MIIFIDLYDYVCMYVYIYIYIYIYRERETCVYIYIYIHIIDVSIYICIYLYEVPAVRPPVLAGLRARALERVARGPLHALLAFFNAAV